MGNSSTSKIHDQGKIVLKMTSGKEVTLNNVLAICIHCDSQSTIARAQNDMYNGKSRPYTSKTQNVKQLLSSGIITIDYIKSKDNLADPFTKGFNGEQVYRSSRGMGLKPMSNESSLRSQDLGSKGTTKL
ncbi:hypothetical protein L3X38_032150 [Prunus dulcis]|uniref:Uncharacterized protein n=1 Tax=Prunus dulcis TaxID=3755 RepID=A0AAD4YWB7_PRUDU|nr:hypothetical protein L3X38_032150 [Prunus dulcis]